MYLYVLKVLRDFESLIHLQKLQFILLSWMSFSGCFGTCLSIFLNYYSFISVAVPSLRTVQMLQ